MSRTMAKGLGIVALVLALSACGAQRDESGAIVESGALDPFKMKVGDCFDDVDSDSDEVESVPGVPCDEPHDNEVYAIFDTSHESWPGEEVMYESASQDCISQFEGFVGMAYEDSELEVYPLYPTLASWNQVDDREIICAVFRANGEKLLGTARNLRR